MHDLVNQKEAKVIHLTFCRILNVMLVLYVVMQIVTDVLSKSYRTSASLNIAKLNTCKKQIHNLKVIGSVGCKHVSFYLTEKISKVLILFGDAIKTQWVGYEGWVH